ncbi:MAG TPA: protein-methionine-sulfoxide reductase heme-binding subunit MsrQ [Pyrinomonadaceae bacterium]|jgi:sulfoxide reductase heme-binding subunit YedZ|nr:protein-methionine-sulfoxide reductase heme-binding subunit MsrQ [Pyrinomonadaceae bacterium]
MSAPDINFTRIVLFTNGLVPATLLAWDAYQGKLGANPIEFATRATGVLTLVFLFLTLAVTPLRKLTGANWLVKFRRLVGLYAFFYGFLHFLTYTWFDKFFNAREIVEDVSNRPFITVGMASFLLLVPLALTSTNGMIKRLGGKRWAKLHKLTYVAAIGGVIHYYMGVKADTTVPLLFAVVLAVLLGYRWIKSRMDAATKNSTLGIQTPPR